MSIGAVILVNGTVDETLMPAEVEVIERVGQTTFYRMRFGVYVQDGDFPMLADPRFDPGGDLGVVVKVGDLVSCIARGPVRGQHSTLVHGGAGSFVDILGGDISIEMDREEKARQWADVTDSDVVAGLLGAYKVTPDIKDTTATHAETRHTMMQRGTDLQLLRRLANRNGYLFWIDWDDSNEATAHFQPPPLDGEAGVELTINLDRPSFQQLEIEWDAERPVSATATQIDLGASDPMDGSVAATTLRALGATPLSGIAQGTQTMLFGAPVDDAADLTTRTDAALSEASFFIRAAGTTTTDAAGALMRAHRLVKLSGIGTRHSGLYFCAGVRHVITADAHTMDLELVRNGWGAA